jgi:tetratricopeptide (TPR) repeat protein
MYFGLYPAKQAGALLAQLMQDPKFQQALKAGKAAEEVAKARDLERQAEAIAKGEDPADPGPPDDEDAAEGPKAGKPDETPKVKPPAKPKEPAKPMTAEERKAARIEHLSRAYDIYRRVATQFPDIAPGKEAAVCMARLEKDAELITLKKQADVDQEARQWLGLAENYFRAGRFDVATEFCDKILAKYPNLPQASQAKALLGRMKR